MHTHMARRSAVVGFWCRSFSKSTFNVCCWKSAFDFELLPPSGLSRGDYNLRHIEQTTYAKSLKSALTVQMTETEG